MRAAVGIAGGAAFKYIGVLLLAVALVAGCSVAAGNEASGGAPSESADGRAAGTAATDGTPAGRAAVRLARRAGELDAAELRRLTALLEENAEVRGFPAEFATSLGARRALGFWSSVRAAHADPGESGDPGGPDRKTVQRLRANLGHTLAAATRTRSPAAAAWRRDLLALCCDGRRGDATGRDGNGFRAVSGLMATGEWDAGFLDAYGRRLLAFERAAVADGVPPRALWAGDSGGRDSADPDRPNPGVAPLAGRDPVTGPDPVAVLLRAASRSPDAATRLFNRRPAAAYLLRYRDHSGTASGPAALDALGAALFAAGSGRTPEDRTSEYAAPTRAQLAATRTGLRLLAGARAPLPPELRAGTGRLLAHHGRLTYETMTEPSPARVPFDRAVLARTVAQVARDGATFGVLDRTLNEVAVHDFRVERTKEQKGGGSAFRAGRVNGFLRFAAGAAFSTGGYGTDGKTGGNTSGEGSGGDEPDEEKPDGAESDGEESARVLRGPWREAAAEAVAGGGLGYLPVPGGDARPGARVGELVRALAEGYRTGDAAGDFTASRMPEQALTASWLATNRDRLSEYEGDGIPEFDGYTLTQWFHVGFEDGEEAARQAGVRRPGTGGP